jgi:predicted polyphosphate/ATP-dependent NAD kinase
MNIETEIDADLTVQSFAYSAKQLARSSAALAQFAQYEQILAEAEKHRSALRLAQRDVLEMAEQGLRKQTLTKPEFHRLCETAAQQIVQAQQAISRIAAQYAPRKLAA